MTALLLILHGSPRPESAAPALCIAEKLEASGRYQQVVVAYMECNQPTIAAGVDICVAAGATTIIAMPYLLHAGRHLVLDVPNQLRESAASHAGVNVLFTDPLGFSPAIADCLETRARQALDKSSTGQS